MRNSLSLLWGSCLAATLSMAHAADLELNAGWNLFSHWGTEQSLQQMKGESPSSDIRIFQKQEDGGWLVRFADQLLTAQKGSWLYTPQSFSLPLPQTTVDGLQGSDWQPGWQLTSLDPSVDTIQSLESSIRQYNTLYAPLRVLSLQAGKWKEFDLVNQRGSLQTLSPGDGYWIKFGYKVAVASGSANGEVGDPLISLENGVELEFYASALPGESGAETVTVTIDSVDYPITLPTVEGGYQMRVWGADGELLSRQAGATSFEAIVTSEDSQREPNPRSITPTLSIWGLDSEGYLHILEEDEVTVRAAGEELETSSVFEGVMLSSAVDSGTELTIDKSGYLPSSVSVSEEHLYITLQEEDEQSEVLLTDEDVNSARPLSRVLRASPAAVAPSSARNDAGASLLFGAGRLNPARSISISVTPLSTLDAVQERSALEESVRTDYLNDTGTDTTADEVTWSHSIIGGGLLTVTDMNSGSPLTGEERSAQQLGAFAEITPYLSTTMGLSIAEVRARLLQNDAEAGLSLVTLSAYAHTPEGWIRFAQALDVIDPAEPSDSVDDALQTRGFAASSIEGRPESITVRYKLPLDSLILTTEASNDQDGQLMSMGMGEGENGGLYDFVFVMTELEAKTESVTFHVVDRETGESLENARVEVEGGATGLTAADGRVTLQRLLLPSTKPFVIASAVRYDHHRSAIPLNFSLYDGDEETIQLRPVSPYASLSGEVTDQTGHAVESATVTLQMPHALSRLKGSLSTGEISVPADSRATYSWKLRPVSGAGGDWYTMIQGATVEEDGNRITLSHLRRWLEQQVLEEHADLPLVGEYQVQAGIAYDLDQDGITDYTENSDPEMISVQSILAPSLFSLTTNLDQVNQTLRDTDGNFGIYNNKNQGFLRIFGGGEGVRFYWSAALQWSGGDQYRYLSEVEGDGDLEWSEIEGDLTWLSLNGGDPARIMGWQSAMTELSKEAIISRLLEASPEGVPYLEGDGESVGLELLLQIRAERNGAALEQAGVFHFRSDVSSESYAGHILSNNGLSVTPQQGELYRTAVTDAEGGYRFEEIDTRFGGADLELGHSLLRVRASKFGMEAASWVSVPLFTTDNAITEDVQEDWVEQDLQLVALPTRPVSVQIVGASHPDGIEGGRVSISEGLTATTDTQGRVEFAAVPTGSHILRVETDETADASYSLYEAPIQIESWYDFGEGESELVELRVSLVEPGWRSSAPPRIEWTVSEPDVNGSVLVEGQAQELRAVSDGVGGQLWQWVPYGFDDSQGEGGARIRNAVHLVLNEEQQPLTLSDVGTESQLSSFREVIQLRPGRNQLQIEAFNHVGRGETVHEEIYHQVTTGSLTGTVQFDSPSGDWASGAELFFRDSEGNLYRTTADTEGVFLMTALPAGSGQLYVHAQNSETIYFAQSDSPISIQQRMRSDAGGLVLQPLPDGVTISTGSPVVRLQGEPQVDGGVLTLQGRIANYDGRGVNGEYRTVQMLMEDKLAAEAAVSQGQDGLWHFTFKVQLPQQNNRVSVRAINLNGSVATSIELLIHKSDEESRVLGDMGVTLQGLVVGEQIRIELYDGVTGNPVLYKEKIADAEEVTVTLDLLDLGSYYYEVETASSALQTGTFELSAENTSLVLENPIPLMESRYLSFKQNSVSIQKIASSKVADVSGVVIVRVPRTESDSITRFGAGLEMVIAGRPAELIELPSQLLEDLGTARDQIAFRTYEVPFSTTVPLAAGINTMHVRLRAKGEIIDSAPTTLFIDDGDGIGNDALTITLDWLTGEDMDLFSYYYPGWPAYQDVSTVKLSPIQAYDVQSGSFNNDTMVQLGQASVGEAGETLSLSGVPDQHQLRLYVDRYRDEALSAAMALSAGISDTTGVDCFETVVAQIDQEYQGDYLVMELERENDQIRTYLEIDQVPSSDLCVGNLVFTNPATHYTFQVEISPHSEDSKRYLGVEVMDLDYRGDPSLDADSQPEHHYWATDEGRAGDGTYLIYVRDNGADGSGLRVRLQGAGLGQITTGRFDMKPSPSSSDQNIDTQPLYLIQVENHMVVRLLSIPVGSELADVMQSLPADQGGFIFEQQNHSSRLINKVKK